jgi:hypothetical protein
MARRILPRVQGLGSRYLTGHILLWHQLEYSVCDRSLGVQHRLYGLLSLLSLLDLLPQGSHRLFARLLLVLQLWWFGV